VSITGKYFGNLRINVLTGNRLFDIFTTCGRAFRRLTYIRG
jgi:hypothetical protein